MATLSVQGTLELDSAIEGSVMWNGEGDHATGFSKAGSRIVGDGVLSSEEHIEGVTSEVGGDTVPTEEVEVKSGQTFNTGVSPIGSLTGISNSEVEELWNYYASYRLEDDTEEASRNSFGDGEAHDTDLEEPSAEIDSLLLGDKSSRATSKGNIIDSDTKSADGKPQSDILVSPNKE